MHRHHTAITLNLKGYTRYDFFFNLLKSGRLKTEMLAAEAGLLHVNVQVKGRVTSYSERKGLPGAVETEPQHVTRLALRSRSPCF